MLTVVAQDVQKPDANSPGLGHAKGQCQQSWPMMCKSLMLTVVAHDVQKANANSRGP